MEDQVEATAEALQSLRGGGGGGGDDGASRSRAEAASKRRRLASSPVAAAPGTTTTSSTNVPPEFLATQAFASPRDFFVRSDAPGAAVESLACTLCDALIGARAYSLKRHLFRHHPSVFRVASAHALALTGADSVNSQDGDVTLAVGGGSDDKTLARMNDAFVAWLRTDEVPLAALASAHFRQFLQALNPAFEVPNVVVRPRPVQRTAATRLMRGLCLRGDGSAPTLRSDLEVPVPAAGEALIRILRAGICGTDLMMVANYKPGFSGVLGHEFVGIVMALGGEEEGEGEAECKREWLGKRVVGEINVPCDADECCTCRAANHSSSNGSSNSSLSALARVKRRNHCPNRAAVGILGKHGVFAEYATLPLANLFVVPDGVVDAHAVFAEPLAAACRVVEQQVIKSRDRVVVLGDGKLGLLVAEVLHAQLGGATRDTTKSERVRNGDDEDKDVIIAAGVGGIETTLVGKHAGKLALMKGVVSHTRTLEEIADGALDGSFDVCVECTGTPSGATLAMRLLRRGGVLVAKSTCSAKRSPVDLQLAQAKHVRVVGSRCGPFDTALALLSDRKVDVQKFIHAAYPLSRAETALEVAGQRGVLKVQLVVA